MPILEKTLLYGIVIAIPAIAVGGIFFSRFLKGYNPEPPEELYNRAEIPDNQMPSFGLSMILALLPALLIAFSALADIFLPADSFVTTTFHFLGEPITALLISVLLAIWLLGTQQGKSMNEVMDTLVESIKGITMILLIIGGLVH